MSGNFMVPADFLFPKQPVNVFPTEFNFGCAWRRNDQGQLYPVNFWCGYGLYTGRPASDHLSREILELFSFVQGAKFKLAH